METLFRTLFPFGSLLMDLGMPYATAAATTVGAMVLGGAITTVAAVKWTRR